MSHAPNHTQMREVRADALRALHQFLELPGDAAPTPALEAGAGVIEIQIRTDPPTRDLMPWIMPLVGRLAADGRILRGYEVSNLDPVGHVIRLRLKGLP